MKRIAWIPDRQLREAGHVHVNMNTRNFMNIRSLQD